MGQIKKEFSTKREAKEYLKFYVDSCFIGQYVIPKETISLYKLSKDVSCMHFHIVQEGYYNSIGVEFAFNAFIDNKEEKIEYYKMGWTFAELHRDSSSHTMLKPLECEKLNNFNKLMKILID